MTDETEETKHGRALHILGAKKPEEERDSYAAMKSWSNILQGITNLVRKEHEKESSHIALYNAFQTDIVKIRRLAEKAIQDYDIKMTIITQLILKKQ